MLWHLRAEFSKKFSREIASIKIHSLVELSSLPLKVLTLLIGIHRSTQQWWCRVKCLSGGNIPIYFPFYGDLPMQHECPLFFVWYHAKLLWARLWWRLWRRLSTARQKNMGRTSAHTLPSVSNRNIGCTELSRDHSKRSLGGRSQPATT